MSAGKERFFAWAGMDYAGIIDRVYRQPLANRFLASISTFVGELLQGKADAKVGLTDEEYKLLKEMLVQVFRRQYCFLFSEVYLGCNGRNRNENGSNHEVSYGRFDSLSFV